MAAVDLGDLKKAAQEPISVETAFLVVIRENGVIQASPDINIPVSPKRNVTMDEIETASLKIAADLQADKTASMVQVRMGQTAQAMQQQAEAAQIARSLKL